MAVQSSAFVHFPLQGMFTHFDDFTGTSYGLRLHSCQNSQETLRAELHSHNNCNARLEPDKLALLKQCRSFCCLANILGSFRYARRGKCKSYGTVHTLSHGERPASGGCKRKRYPFNASRSRQGGVRCLILQSPAHLITCLPPPIHAFWGTHQTSIHPSPYPHSTFLWIKNKIVV